MIRLSIAMIVKNESRHLDGCLRSIKGLADELIVIDTGSTDVTIDIALSNGAAVDTFRWCDDYSAARNFSLSKCTGDWIFVIDADEQLDPGFHKTLRENIQSGIAGVYYYAWRHHHQVGHIDDSKGWLFVNREDIRFVGRCHEKLVATGPKLVRGWCDILVHHYGFMDQQRSIEKEATYTRLMSMEG